MYYDHIKKKIKTKCPTVFITATFEKKMVALKYPLVHCRRQPNISKYILDSHSFQNKLFFLEDFQAP